VPDFTIMASDMILQNAIAEKKNIVIEITGDNYNLFKPVLDKMIGVGYKPNINSIFCDPIQAYERHIKAVQNDKSYWSAYYTEMPTLSFFYKYFQLGKMPNARNVNN